MSQTRVEDWTAADIGRFLKENDLEEFCLTFYHNGFLVSVQAGVCVSFRPARLAGVSGGMHREAAARAQVPCDMR
jgi:hypothetical protein